MINQHRTLEQWLVIVGELPRSDIALIGPAQPARASTGAAREHRLKAWQEVVEPGYEGYVAKGPRVALRGRPEPQVA